MDNQSSINNSIRIKWLYLPAFLYLIFVVYGSLVPMQFHFIPLDEAISRFTKIPFLQLGIGSRADWVANGLLFIPLTFMLTGSFWQEGKTVFNVILSAIIFIFACWLSLAIEFTQLFFPGRTVSQNDIAAETIGGFTGVLTWWLIGSIYLNYITHLRKASGTRSVSEIILWGYLAVLFGYSLLPLDLTISPVEIYHKWVSGKVVLLPFSALPNTPIEFIYELVTDVLIWVPVSVLFILGGRKKPGDAIIWTLAAATILELLQLFVFSRTSDITDIFSGFVGAVIGAFVAGRINRDKPVIKTQNQNPNIIQIAKGVALFSVWTIFLLLVFWYPYDFNFERSFLRHRVDGFSSAPFTSYYYGSEFRAITELLRRIFFFIPLGASLYYGKPITLPTHLSRFYTACAMIMILGVATVVELGQTALPTKFPNNTDILLQFLGGFIGFCVAGYIANRMKNKNS